MNFDHFRVSKMAILTHFGALIFDIVKFDFVNIKNILQSKSRASKIVKITVL